MRISDCSSDVCSSDLFFVTAWSWKPLAPNSNLQPWQRSPCGIGADKCCDCQQLAPQFSGRPLPKGNATAVRPRYGTPALPSLPLRPGAELCIPSTSRSPFAPCSPPPPHPPPP